MNGSRGSFAGERAHHERGCIILAALLGDVMVTWRRDLNLVNLLLDEAFRAIIGPRQESWRSNVQTAVGLGIPATALSGVGRQLRRLSQ